MKNTYASVSLLLALLVSGCGSSSESTTAPTNIPISLTIENAELSAGIPKTFTYIVPAPDKPYTDVAIDLNKTLERVNITVTPTP